MISAYALDLQLPTESQPDRPPLQKVTPKLITSVNAVRIPSEKLEGVGSR